MPSPDTRPDQPKPLPRAFVPLFVLACAALLLPLATTRILPQNDGPNHLSVAYVLHHIDDPASNLRDFYDVSITPVPYIAYYLLVHAVAFLTGVELANRIVLGLHLLSFPVAALLWARRTGREPWLALLVLPLAYSFSWSIGFYPFYVGVSLFLFATLALDAFLLRPSRGSAALVAALALANDFGHLLAIPALYASAAALLVAHRPPRRRLAATVGLLAPGALLFAWQLLRPRVSWIAPQGTATRAFAPEYVGVGAMLEDLPKYAADSVSGPLDMALFAVPALTVLGLCVAGLVARRAEPRPTWKERLFAHRAGLIAIAMAALYLGFPLHLHAPFDWWFVSGRYAPLLCFFLFLLPPGELAGKKRWLFLPAVLAALALPLHVARKYADFASRTRPFIRMVERAEPGSRVLFLRMGPMDDRAVNVPVWNHFGSWVQIIHGGYSNAGWFDAPVLVFARKKLPSPPYHQHRLFNDTQYGSAYRYIIVHREARPLYPPGSPLARVVDREGEWTMYERLRAEP